MRKECSGGAWLRRNAFRIWKRSLVLHDTRPRNFLPDLLSPELGGTDTCREEGHKLGFRLGRLQSGPCRRGKARPSSFSAVGQTWLRQNQNRGGVWRRSVFHFSRRE